MSTIFNQIKYTARRRALRRSMSKAEVVLWTHLSRRQMEGCKFRRQYSVNQFVIDFYCPQLKLAIEIDGDSHFKENSENKDAERQAFIEAFGINFMRFTNNDIYENIDGVLQTIHEWIANNENQKSTSPHVPSSLRRG
jgi:very-short-patch-repair endonuclease